MKIDGLCGEPEPLAPRLDQQRDELPLRAARVLELVDEDVVVARFEAKAALGELVHLPQQIERALEHVREIEDRSLLERLAVLRERDREHPLDAAREHDVEVAREAAKTTFSMCGAIWATAARCRFDASGDG